MDYQDLETAQKNLNEELKLLLEALKMFNAEMTQMLDVAKETVELLEAHTNYLNQNNG